MCCHFHQFETQMLTPYLTHYTHPTFFQLLIQYKLPSTFFILIFTFELLHSPFPHLSHLKLSFLLSLKVKIRMKKFESENENEEG